jgi:hypothetical protein
MSRFTPTEMARAIGDGLLSFPVTPFRPVRPPLTDLTEAEHAELAELIAAARNTESIGRRTAFD